MLKLFSDQPSCDDIAKIHGTIVWSFEELDEDYTGVAAIYSDQDDITLFDPSGYKVACSWKKNSKITEYCEFKNGKPNGVNAAWHNNGQLEFKSLYKNGLPEGVCVGYHPNGELEHLHHYKDGKMDGKQSYYHNNKYEKFTMNYKNGDLTDEFVKFHDREGVVVKINHYEDGILVGQFDRCQADK